LYISPFLGIHCFLVMGLPGSVTDSVILILPSITFLMTQKPEPPFEPAPALMTCRHLLWPVSGRTRMKPLRAPYVDCFYLTSLPYQRCQRHACFSMGRWLPPKPPIKSKSACLPPHHHLWLLRKYYRHQHQ